MKKFFKFEIEEEEMQSQSQEVIIDIYFHDIVIVIHVSMMSNMICYMSAL